MQKYLVLYCRVSDENQLKRGHSMEEQEPMLRKHAKQEGYIVLKVFKDRAKSGTSTHKRDGLLDAIRFIQQQNKNIKKPKVHAFLVQDTDRLARDEFDHFHIRHELRNYKVELLSKNQPHIDDSPEGRLMDTLMAGVNAFQSRLTGRKVKDTVTGMVGRGLTTYKSPIGYLNINEGTEDEPKRTVIFDPKRKKLVRMAFELYGTGNYTSSTIAIALNKKGLETKQGTPMSRSSVNDLLRNPYYIGKLRRYGKDVTGVHPSLIDEPLFMKCKAMLKRKRHYASRERNPENIAKFFMKDYLRGGKKLRRMTGETVKGNSKHYSYYLCTNAKYNDECGGVAPNEVIEKQVEGFFGLLQLGDDVVDEVLQRAKEILSETHNDVDEEKKRLDREITSLEAERQVFEIKLGKGVVTDEVYQRNTDRIENEIAEAKERIEKISEQRQDNKALFEGLVFLARNVSKAYKKASPEVKKMYLSIFWDYFQIQNKEVSKAVPSKAVQALVNEKLITLKQNTPQRKILISKVWLPILYQFTTSDLLELVKYPELVLRDVKRFLDMKIA